jgi:hypothetical protein
LSAYLLCIYCSEIVQKLFRNQVATRIGQRPFTQNLLEEDWEAVWSDAAVADISVLGSSRQLCGRAESGEQADSQTGRVSLFSGSRFA